MPSLSSKSMRKETESPVETALVERAMNALLKHHEQQTQKSEKESLLGNDQVVHVQFGLDLVPENPSIKPIRVLIPHPLYKVSEDSLDGDDDGLEEPSVCLIVKEESKKWVQELLEQFPQHMKFVKKVLGLQSLRKKHARFQQRRELLHRFDVFMADDRILPMLAKCLGKDFIKAKKQPIPVALTRKNSLPFNILQSLQATFMYISSGTCLSIRAGNTGMPVNKLVDNIQSIIENAVPKIPRKWANVRSIALKTPESTSLPIYNKTPEELMEIAKMAGITVEKEQQQQLQQKEESDTPVDDVDKEDIEKVQERKRKLAAKSPLVQALKKQKQLEKEEAKNKEEKAKDKSSAKQKKRKQSIGDDESTEPLEPLKRDKKHVQEDMGDSGDGAKQKKAEKAKDKSSVKKKKQKQSIDDVESTESLEPANSDKKHVREETGDSADGAKRKKRKQSVGDDSTESPKPAKGGKKDVASHPDAEEEPVSFVASKKYAGSKKGYVFRNGKKGVGYYLDVKPVVDERAMEALKRAAQSSKGVRKKSKGRKGGRRY